MYSKAAETELNLIFRVYSINNSNQHFPKIEVKILKRTRVIEKKAFCNFADGELAGNAPKTEKPEFYLILLPFWTSE